MTNRSDIDMIIEDRPRRRVKRDYVPNEFPFIGPREKRQIPQAYFEGRIVPRMPFQDPLYNDQWYLVSWLQIFKEMLRCL